MLHGSFDLRNAGSSQKNVLGMTACTLLAHRKQTPPIIPLIVMSTFSNSRKISESIFLNTPTIRVSRYFPQIAISDGTPHADRKMII